MRKILVVILFITTFSCDNREVVNKSPEEATTDSIMNHVRTNTDNGQTAKFLSFGKLTKEIGCLDKHAEAGCIADSIYAVDSKLNAEASKALGYKTDFKKSVYDSIMLDVKKRRANLKTGIVGYYKTVSFTINRKDGSTDKRSLCFVFDTLLTITQVKNDLDLVRDMQKSFETEFEKALKEIESKK